MQRNRLVLLSTVMIFFSNEAERVYQMDGLDAFATNWLPHECGRSALSKDFSAYFHQIQTKFPAESCLLSALPW